ncbi:MAG: ABC transporter ATP-binding protein [Gemmatimonadetes bacterium]|nr:ABC transporter ATP-binding protein [Gemmatimonadota bacterium]
MLAFSLAGTALSLTLPYLFRAFVDRALVGRDATALVEIVSLFFGITLASFAINVASGLRYTRISAEILFDMRLALFRHLQALSPRFYARMPLGQIVSRLNNDVGEIQRVVTEVALAWVSNVLFLVGTVVILVMLDPVLFAASLAVVPFAFWALVRYRTKLERSIRDMRDESAAMGTFLIDTLQAMKLVVGLNAQEREAVRFRARNDGFVTALMAMRQLTFLAGGLPGLLLTLGSAAVLFLGGMRVIEQQITVGTLIAFVAYQVRLLSPIQGLMGLYAGIATARVSLGRVQEILDVAPEVVEKPGAPAIATARGEVVLRNVTIAHGRPEPVLDRVSVTVRAGERVAIVGASGAGKSTIADLLARHLDPDNGAVVLDGHDLRDMRVADVRRHVVVLDQEPFVFNASIEDNLRFARPDASEGDIREALQASGLSEFVARCPDGVKTIVGERGRALSAGERQRLAIARAFLADPTVLVLDEATGALDPATESEVVAGYDAVMRGRTTVVITHREALASRAERAVVLERGSVAAEGAPGALAESGGPWRRVFA